MFVMLVILVVAGVVVAGSLLVLILGVANHPPCPSCGRRMHVSSEWDGTTMWTCYKCGDYLEEEY